jgi:geranylgeranyl pyrophosphate synthase
VSLADRFLEPDAGMARLVADLVDRLPASSTVGEPLESRFWDEALLDPARDIVSRSGKGIRATLVERGWELAGATGTPPMLLSALIELLHVGSLVIDDIEDDSATRRGQPTLHRRYGLPTALNTGNWLYFLALALLARLRLDAGLRLAMYEDVTLALLRCHQGQALDLSVDVTRLRRDEVPALVAQSTGLKTGALMELAAVLGARAAGADAPTVARVGAFASAYGVGLQMLDDWSGLARLARRAKGAEDIRLARPTWPWAWLARHADEVTFADLQHQARAVDTDADAECVIERMHGALAVIAEGEINRHLSDARRDLSAAFGGEHPAIRLLDRDIDALERAYG